MKLFKRNALLLILTHVMIINAHIFFFYRLLGKF